MASSAGNSIAKNRLIEVRASGTGLLAAQPRRRLGDAWVSLKTLENAGEALAGGADSARPTAACRCHPPRVGAQGIPGGPPVRLLRAAHEGQGAWRARKRARIDVRHARTCGAAGALVPCGVTGHGCRALGRGRLPVGSRSLSHASRVCRSCRLPPPCFCPRPRRTAARTCSSGSAASPARRTRRGRAARTGEAGGHGGLGAWGQRRRHGLLRCPLITPPPPPPARPPAQAHDGVLRRVPVQAAAVQVRAGASSQGGAVASSGAAATRGIAAPSETRTPHPPHPPPHCPHAPVCDRAQV